MSSWELVQLCVRQPTGLESVPFRPPLEWSKSLSQLVGKVEKNALWLWLDPAGMRTSRLYPACSQESPNQPLDIGILDANGLKDLWNNVWRADHPQPADRGVWALLARVKLDNPQPPNPLPESASELPRADFLKELTDRFTVDGLRDKLERRWELVSRLVGGDQYNPSTSYLRERFYETVTQYLVGDLCQEFYSALVPVTAAAAPLEAVQPQPHASATANASPQVSVLSAIVLDPIEIHVGRSLLKLVDPKLAGPLFKRIPAIRHQMALQLGVVVPGVRFRDNLRLKTDEYQILLFGQVVARGQLQVSQMLALGAEHKVKILAEGADPKSLVKDPLYGIEGIWTTDRERCHELGMLLLDATSVLASHLTDVCMWRASELFCYQSYCGLLDFHKKSHPGLHQALEARAIDPVKIWQLLQELLSERVSIRDMTRILQTVLVHPTHSLEQWVETCRAALVLQITEFYTEGSGTLEVVLLQPEQEEVLRQGSNSELESLCRKYVEYLQGPTDRGWGVNFLTEPDCRRALRDLLRPSLPRAVFLSRRELSPEVTLQPLELFAAPPPQAASRSLPGKPKKG